MRIQRTHTVGDGLQYCTLREGISTQNQQAPKSPFGCREYHNTLTSFPSQHLIEATDSVRYTDK